MFNPEEARRFIAALTGSDETSVHFQCYFDPDKKLGLTPGPDGYAEEWFSTFDESLEFLQFKQENDCGAYVCINETDGLGRKEENITSLRCFLVDFDGQDEPEWVLPPHIINKRDETHGHAFWLIDAGDCTLDEWSVIQYQLAMFYDTDPQVVDPCRVIRLPGSKHLKDPWNPQEYVIIEDNSDCEKYTVQDVREAHTLPADLDAELTRWAEARMGIMDGTGFDDSEQEITRFVRFLGNARPAVPGMGATHEVYRVSLYGRDHGISFETCCELMWEHYNPRCEPPWEPEEYDHFIGPIFRAYKYAVSAPGCKTVVARFRELPKPAEPECGWESYREAQIEREDPHLTEDDMRYVKPVVHSEIDVPRDPRRLSFNDAEVLWCQLTAKSPHYKFAQVFDGIQYDGINMMRCKSQFYRYNGKHHQPVDDSIVKAEIQRAFSSFEPSDSFTNGIFRVFRDYVTAEYELEVGKLISDPESDTSNMIVFNNGILDISGEQPTLTNHSPDLFNLNALPHDYNPESECPQWIEFLRDAFSGDEDLIKQLQMWFGYCLTSDVSLEKFALFKGRPRSGKGTITTMLSALIGKNSVAAPTLDMIHTATAKEEMATKTLALIPEAEEIPSNVKTSVLGTVKAITGGDSVSYHKMYVGSMSSVFKIHLNMTTNKMPVFNDPSGALVARMLVFPFYKSYVGKEDFTLKTRLLEEVSGVTNWAIEGLRMLRENGNRFIEPEVSLREKEALKADMSPLSQFFKKMCKFEEEAESTIEELYSMYRIWAASQGMTKPMTMGRFTQAIRDAGVPVEYYELGSESGFKGITVKHDIGMSNVVPGRFGRVQK